MTCTSCGTENKAGRKFCANCGVALALLCPSCGAANEPGDRFCGECGTGLADAAAAPAAQPDRVAERRLVSVLFADLVGFTTLSESRDAEEVRDLLSRYFEMAQTLIGRYGGTIEKFIGDAVMAVWGTPVTREDDAERAVRAGLDLVGAVAALGAEVGAEGLAARAGVATGEAAVTLRAEGQGMVAGDLVNTAARVQSAAEPGTVFVTDDTRRVSEAAVVYDDAGSHELKGKAEPLHLSRAVRIIAGRMGSLRSSGLESPFVGRDREFRLVKDLFHGTADERRAHLVSVHGIAGIGKSRLAWEFEKYVDGLVDVVYWHRGRCMPYGEGVSFWALAEMVRMRAGIAEEEDPISGAAKLADAVRTFVPDPEERRYIGSRLAALLGYDDDASSAREDLSAGWRMFFERIAERGPTVLVFEDLQWADDALLDFIQTMLHLSRDRPLFVVTLFRPELLDRRPDWGTRSRGFTSVLLEPLSDAAMDALLAGMVPGMPEEIRVRIRAHAEGIPLYAVETVRMLLDRGALVRTNGRFDLVGEVGQLDVPASLHGLIAARLDALPTEERSLLQDASVLGKTFHAQTLAAVAHLSLEEIQPSLDALVRKELLSLQTDPRSPERGQYGFLQSLVQKVAHDTLAKKDRRAKHLVIAEHLESTWAGDEDEIVEVVAAHRLEAYALAPDAPDAAEIRAKAASSLEKAGRRAESLAATRRARGYYEEAAGLTDDSRTRAELLEHAGAMAHSSGFSPDAVELWNEAERLFNETGATHDAARVAGRCGEALWLNNRVQEALERTEPAYAVLEGDEPDRDLAWLAAQIARFRFFHGDLDESFSRVEKALQLAEDLWVPDVLSDALNTKSLLMDTWGRYEEAIALLRRSFDLALEHDIPRGIVRAATNLSYTMDGRDRLDEANGYMQIGIDTCRRLGFLSEEWFLRQHVAGSALRQGRWDELLEQARTLPDPQDEPASVLGAEAFAFCAAIASIERGDPPGAVDLIDRWIDVRQRTEDRQRRLFIECVRAVRARAQDDVAGWLGAARSAFEARHDEGMSHGFVKWAFAEAMTAALAQGDLATAEALWNEVAAMPPGRPAPKTRADLQRFSAALAMARGEKYSIEANLKAAIGLYREIGLPFDTAAAELELAEWLVRSNGGAEATDLLDDARTIFEGLRATPWLERVAAISPVTTG
jgi:class 3 adenylate cyclase/predicted ATPase